MRSIKTINVIALLFYFVVCNGQSVNKDFELMWCKDQKPFKEGYIDNMKIISSNEKYICYFLKTIKYSFIGGVPSDLMFLVKHDKSTGEFRSIEISPRLESNKLKYLASDTINKLYHVFSYFHNKAQNKLYVFDQTFELNDLVSNNDIKKIYEVDLKGKGILQENMLFVSSNGRYILRYSVNSEKGKKYSFEVFNKSLQNEWGRDCLEKADAGYNIESNYRVDNEGNVYAIQSNCQNQNEADNGMFDNRIRIVYYPRNNAQNQSLTLKLQGNLNFRCAQIDFNFKNQLVCAGLYSSTDLEKIGAFSYLIEPKLSTISTSQNNEFSNDMKTKGIDLKIKNEYVKKEMNSKNFEKKFIYNLKDIYFKKDGSYDLIAEKHFYEGFISNGIINVTHYFDDLWVMNFNPDGSFKWVQKIPKYEYINSSYFDIGSYYAFHNKNDELNLIYNLAVAKINFAVINCTSSTYFLQLDSTGKETSKELINERDQINRIVPAYSYKDSNDMITLVQSNSLNRSMYTMKYNNFIFGQLKFN